MNARCAIVALLAILLVTGAGWPASVLAQQPIPNQAQIIIAAVDRFGAGADVQAVMDEFLAQADSQGLASELARALVKAGAQPKSVAAAAIQTCLSQGLGNTPDTLAGVIEGIRIGSAEIQLDDQSVRAEVSQAVNEATQGNTTLNQILNAVVNESFSQPVEIPTQQGTGQAGQANQGQGQGQTPQQGPPQDPNKGSGQSPTDVPGLNDFDPTASPS